MFDGYMEPHDNDLRIEIWADGEGSCWDFLSNMTENLIEETEKVMCEANAKEVYQVACNLEYWAAEIRRTYERWKLNDFQKTKGA